MLPKEQILLIIYFTVIILFFAVFAIVFFIAFQKRKNKLLLDKLKSEQQFEEELKNSKIEIQEQTLKNVSWELHDNIGQLLSTAVMQINILSTQVDDQLDDSVENLRGLVGDTLQEIRSLSRSLNHEVIQNIGLEKSIQGELARFEKMNFLETHFDSHGEHIQINAKDEIILYRMIQEFFSNTIKYAEAGTLSVSLNYTEESLEIHVKDDGKGFEMETVQASSGLINMKSRAELVKATLELKSAPEQGTELQLLYPFKNEDLIQYI